MWAWNGWKYNEGDKKKGWRKVGGRKPDSNIEWRNMWIMYETKLNFSIQHTYSLCNCHAPNWMHSYLHACIQQRVYLLHQLQLQSLGAVATHTHTTFAVFTALHSLYFLSTGTEEFCVQPAYTHARSQSCTRCHERRILRWNSNDVAWVRGEGRRFTIC